MMVFKKSIFYSAWGTVLSLDAAMISFVLSVSLVVIAGLIPCGQSGCAGTNGSVAD